jgi:hypothetical protein
MSSDESEHEAGQGQKTYCISLKRWQSQKTTAILHTLDALHLRSRYRQQWDATPGAWPSLRSISLQKVSTRAAVRALPINLYSKVYLLSLTPEEFSELGPDKEAIPLDIPKGIAA